ncbi:MAG: hypothetical protein QOG34_953 [Frankiaceae bacterium]|nr:hypothetical protein [Frankiaceae bacterium]
MRQRVLAPAAGALILAFLAWPVSAAATGVAPNARAVSGAFVATGSCGSLSGMGVSWTSRADTVTSVSLTSIPASCAGGQLSLTLVGAGNAALASAGPVSISSTSQTLSSFTGSAGATSVVGAYISVVGP